MDGLNQGFKLLYASLFDMAGLQADIDYDYVAEIISVFPLDDGQFGLVKRTLPTTEDIYRLYNESKESSFHRDTFRNHLVAIDRFVGVSVGDNVGWALRNE